MNNIKLRKLVGLSNIFYHEHWEGKLGLGALGKLITEHVMKKFVNHCTSSSDIAQQNQLLKSMQF